MQVYIIIACVVTLVVAAPVTWLISTTYHKKVTDKKIGSAEAKACLLYTSPSPRD